MFGYRGTNQFKIITQFTFTFIFFVGFSSPVRFAFFLVCRFCLALFALFMVDNCFASHSLLFGVKGHLENLLYRQKYNDNTDTIATTTATLCREAKNFLFLTNIKIQEEIIFTRLNLSKNDQD